MKKLAVYGLSTMAEVTGTRSATTKSRARHNAILVRISPGKGRGVFALRRFRKGEVIERAPVIVLPDPEWKHLEKTALRDHYFAWGKSAAAFALGYISMYNHSYSPNAFFRMKRADLMIEVVALQSIEANAEILANYNARPGAPGANKPMWFKVVE